MKKILTVVLIILAILIVGILIFSTNVEVEYVPEEEISNIDLRKTMVTLYFQNAENKELQVETRLIDSKELLLDPYTKLINLLFDGPENSYLLKTVPEGTKVLGCELIGECLNVNLSEEFINNSSEDETEKNNYIYSIVNTLTELKEVNSVKFLIEGEEVDGLNTPFSCKKGDNVI